MIQALLYAAVALAGLLAGVAVNVAADAVSGDEEPPWRAATCHKCGARLPAARLLPLVTLAGGRRACPACGARSSLRRPLLSLGVALALPLLLAHLQEMPGSGRLPLAATFVIDAAVICVLAFIFAVDLEHRLILDIAIYVPLLALALIAVVADRKALAAMLLGVIVCGGLFLLLYGLGFLLYHQEALGFGDVKLAALLGVAVGWPAITTALVLGAVAGAAVSLLLLGLGAATRRTFIPFGIFLAAGAMVALLVAPPFW
jgi:leader peptidase (prepilin peptidase) / N-methyltransferase